MLDIETFRNYCLQKPGVTESFPFDETTLVFKVGGKMFALTDLEDSFRMTLKSKPEDALVQREAYPEVVIPGYHMNKKHWNTINLDKYPLPSDSQLYQWIDDSYHLIFTSLTKKQQAAIAK